MRLRSDEQLVASFRAGNEAAFDVIHDRYRQRLLAYTRQMLGGSLQDAEDALQDVFLRAYSALRASDRPVSLRAWLYRVAHNRCIDQLRRPAPAPADVFEVSRLPAADPLAAAERREDLRRLVVDVRRLPDQQRSALLLRELDGLSYAELADVLGVTVAAVKSLLIRARTGLVAAGEARDAACAEIRTDLVLSHDRGVRASGHARRHLRDCPGCREYRRDLRQVRRSLGAFAPTAGPLGGVLAKLFGIGGGGAAAGGGAAVGTSAVAGGSVATGGGVLATATACKVAAIACAAVVTGGAIEATQVHQPKPHESAPAAAAPATPAASAAASVAVAPVVHATDLPVRGEAAPAGHARTGTRSGAAHHRAAAHRHGARAKGQTPAAPMPSDASGGATAPDDVVHPGVAVTPVKPGATEDQRGPLATLLDPQPDPPAGGGTTQGGGQPGSSGTSSGTGSGSGAGAGGGAPSAGSTGSAGAGAGTSSTGTKPAAGSGTTSTSSTGTKTGDAAGPVAQPASTAGTTAASSSSTAS